MPSAQTATTAGVANHPDAQLAGQHKPDLRHTMTALALALALGGEDANDVDLFDPLAATSLVDHTRSDSTIRRHKELAKLGDTGTAAVQVGMKAARQAVWAVCTTDNPAAVDSIDHSLTVDLNATEILSPFDKEKQPPPGRSITGSTHCARSSITAPG